MVLTHELHFDTGADMWDNHGMDVGSKISRAGWLPPLRDPATRRPASHGIMSERSHRGHGDNFGSSPVRLWITSDLHPNGL